MYHGTPNNSPESITASEAVLNVASEMTSYLTETDDGARYRSLRVEETQNGATKKSTDIVTASGSILHLSASYSPKDEAFFDYTMAIVHPAVLGNGNAAGSQYMRLNLEEGCVDVFSRVAVVGDEQFALECKIDDPARITLMADVIKESKAIY